MKRLIKAEVVGKSRYEFRTDDGKQLSGSTLYVMYEKPDVEGTACGKVSSPDSAGPVAVGDYVLIVDGAKPELVVGDA